MDALDLSSTAKEMKKDLAELSSFAFDQISACKDEKELQEIKVSFLGKKGKLTAILKQMRELSNLLWVF